jgi:ribose transport system ATP-binding protein
MTKPRLVIRKLNKAFASPVLRDVDLTVGRGEVHGLVGENGAGKSTLVKILAGLLSKDSGEVALDGELYEPSQPGDAFDAGVSFAAQELSVIGTLSVAENIALRRLPQRKGIIARETLEREARRMLEMVGLDRGSPETLAENLSIADRQLVEIAKAMRHDCRLLLLDEPTAALTPPQADRLHEIITDLSAAGTSVLYISHRLEDVLNACDSVTVLRDGRVAMSESSGTVSVDDLVKAMAGRIFELGQVPSKHAATDVPALEVREIQSKRLPHPISFSLRRGEIVGIAGLEGSGRSELLHAVFGLDPISTGRVIRHVDGIAVPIRNARMATRCGMAMLGEDRQSMGLYPGQSVLSNIMVPGRAGARESAPLRMIDSAAERAASSALVDKLAIRCSGLGQDIAELSGGNQQKVLIARWLHCDSELFLLDEPTRGVDVGTKSAIYDLLRELREAGKSILLASSEIEELMAVCDRILVLSNRRLVKAFERGEGSEASILEAAFQEYTSAGRSVRTSPASIPE